MPPAFPRWPRTLGLALVVGAGVGCEAEAWLGAAGLRAFREVGAPEAHEILADPGANVLQVAGSGSRGRIPGALVVGPEDPLPETLCQRGRVLVVAAEGAPGRLLSARLVRAGCRRVTLLVADPGSLGGGPQVARPLLAPPASKP